MVRHILALVACVALSSSTVACAADTENEAVAADTADQEMVGESAKFQVFDGEDGTYSFRFVAGNGAILLRSTSHATRQSVDSGIEALLEYAPDARNIEQLEAKGGAYYFVVKGPAGEVLGTSDTYASKASSVRGARAVSSLARLLRSEY